MKSYASRRLRNITLTVIGLGGIAAWLNWRQESLQPTSFQSGYLLLGALFFLALYNLRKKLPISVWTTSAGWLQAHIYVGLSSAMVFGLHVGWRFPDGNFELALTILYAATFLTGLIGLYWTRTLPPKLARVSEEVIYERIPKLRNRICERAQNVVLETVKSSATTTLGEFYSSELHYFFERPCGWRYMLRPNNSLRRQMLKQLTEVNRYLSEPEQESCEELFSLIRKRDDLDYQQALQWRLKIWFFAHIGLTYPLLLAACLHGWLAHLYHGGAL